MSADDMPPMSSPDDATPPESSEYPEQAGHTDHADHDTDVSPDYDTAGAALGALSAEEFDMLQSAADLDPSVAAEFAAMQAVVAELSRLDPAQAMNRGRSAGIRSRLLSKAVSAPRTAAHPSPSPKAARGPAANMLADVADVADVAGVADSASASVPSHRTVPSRDGVSSSTQSRVPSSVPTGAAVGATSTTSAAREAREARDVRDARQAKSAQSVHPLQQPIPRRAGIHPAWLVLAAGLVIAVGGVQQWRITQERDAVEQSVAARDNGYLKRVAMLEAAVASRDSVVQALTGPSMKVVDLVNYSSQAPLARMFWDRKTAEWTMYAYNIRQPRPGKIFQVWLIANNVPAPISAGTFTPDARGAAVMHAKYALDQDALVKIAVSEEPAPGVPAPTGPIIIAGAGR